MPRPLTEHDIQRAFVLWFASARRPGVIGWHTPNGGRRDGFGALRLAQLGVVAGIPDYLILAGGRVYGLEFKRPGGRLSPAQTALHLRLIEAGAAIATVESLDAAKKQVAAWGLVDNEQLVYIVNSP